MIAYKPIPQTLWVRLTCPACRGAGKLASTLTPACRRCGAAWSAAHFDAWIEAYDRPRWFRRNRYKWLTLPCGCDLAYLVYHRAPCAECLGAGYIYQPAR